MVNLVFNDCTSKPKLPIFRLTMAMAKNIFTFLLLSRTLATTSSTNLGLRFYGVSSLKPFPNDACTLSHICNSWPTSKPFPSVDLGLLCDTIILAILWTLNGGFVKTTYGTEGWCCWFICVCISTSSWCASIYVWKSYMSSISFISVC